MEALNEDIMEEVYVKQPPRIEMSNCLSCIFFFLDKALCGLKASF